MWGYKLTKMVMYPLLITSVCWEIYQQRIFQPVLVDS